MAQQRIVTGTHTFTYEHIESGGCAAEYEGRCHYKVALPPGPRWSPLSGDDPEILEIADLEVFVTKTLPPGDPRRATTGRTYVREWVEPSEGLKQTFRAYLLGAGADDLIDTAREGEALSDAMVYGLGMARVRP
ncbi:hypothetical protein [Fodinicurvata sediminis]|uniref:hypothetical protein n=1 Tax=Fodinicurvata sediminis TaxID=1121832 RepID=UPI0003B36AA1|nr:hypothetical protein [Fodinicurvata sediminis]